MTGPPPLVSIGIPSYNRVGLLERAIRSCLSQDHPNIEVVVSDNASDDGTPELVERLAGTDERIRLIRQPTNHGPTHNFNAVRSACRGDYLMWLGDDDWLEPDYVSTCLAALQRDPGLALVAGSVRYEQAGRHRSDGRTIELASDDPGQRVLGYYRTVTDNGTFYGLSPRWATEQTAGLTDSFGNDWYLLAELAALGRFGVAASTVHREVGGATVSLRNVARGGGHARLVGEVPQLALAVGAVRSTFVLPAFRPLGWRRVPLALRCGWTVLRRFLPTAVVKYAKLTASRVAGLARRHDHSATGPSLPMETGEPVEVRAVEEEGGRACAQ